jgi:molybdopterin-biosynthesis enzyme MoeA-like protein
MTDAPSKGGDVTRFGLYVVGDEILSGRRSDRHLAHVIALLRARNLSLSWAQFLGDERAALEAAYRTSLAGEDVVFSCGGIGATPDDHTRHAVAAALGVGLELQPQARDLIARAVAKRGLVDLSSPDGRRALMMGEFPKGARLLPNSYNGIPGFAVARHFFVPGFPVMAWPMIEWVLDNELGAAGKGAPQLERSLLLYGMVESAIIPLMQDIEARFAGVRTFSLPSVGDGADGRPERRHIELGVKGAPDLALAAFDDMVAQLRAKGAEIDAPVAAGLTATAMQQ